MAKYNLHVDDVSVEAMFNKVGGVEGARRLLRGETRVAPVGGNILTIDRSVSATYPDWKKDLADPEFENTGPITVDPLSTILYLHPKQKNGERIGGTELYKFLKSTGLIEHGLDLRFGEELVKHLQLFPTAWKGKYVFLWKSVVLDRRGGLGVPYVCEDGGAVRVYWHWLGHDFDDGHPAVLSAS